VNIIRDTHGAIGIEPLAGKIRLLTDPAAGGEKPAFNGACNYLHLSERELVITALSGKGITRAQLRLIAWWAHGAGYRWIYADRMPGHSLPMATRRTVRPLLDWFEIDLERVISAAPRRDAHHA